MKARAWETQSSVCDARVHWLPNRGVCRGPSSCLEQPGCILEHMCQAQCGTREKPAPLAVPTPGHVEGGLAESQMGNRHISAQN